MLSQIPLGLSFYCILLCDDSVGLSINGLLRTLVQTGLSHSENQDLHALVTELNSQVGQLQRNTQFRWLMGGGALVLLGLAFGTWIKSRPKRSTWV